MLLAKSFSVIIHSIIAHINILAAALKNVRVGEHHKAKHEVQCNCQWKDGHSSVAHFTSEIGGDTVEAEQQELISPVY